MRRSDQAMAAIVVQPVLTRRPADTPEQAVLVDVDLRERRRAPGHRLHRVRTIARKRGFAIAYRASAARSQADGLVSGPLTPAGLRKCVSRRPSCGPSVHGRDKRRATPGGGDRERQSVVVARVEHQPVQELPRRSARRSGGRRGTGAARGTDGATDDASGRSRSSASTRS